MKCAHNRETSCDDFLSNTEEQEVHVVDDREAARELAKDIPGSLHFLSCNVCSKSSQPSFIEVCEALAARNLKLRTTKVSEQRVRFADGSHASCLAGPKERLEKVLKLPNNVDIDNQALHH